jgi:uncharacterized protein DUF2442
MTPRYDTCLTPDITRVAVPQHGRLQITFADGVVGEVDVLDRMRGPVFEPVLTPEGFAEVRVDPEVGTVTWPNGANLAPDTLYERVRTGRWPTQVRPRKARSAALLASACGLVGIACWRAVAMLRRRAKRGR